MVTLHLGRLLVSSPDFDPEGPIPPRHAADGENTSPALEFSNVPPSARSLALVCHDPDAPATHGFDHWVLYDIPADATGVTRGGDRLATEGENSAGTLGYTGPAPPPGHGRHHYFFHLYALDVRLDAPGGLTRTKLLDLADAHIVEQARLVGTYRVDPVDRR
jgi:Raf kinase inhibitor-like YbhB/YbcL family protein